jgi:predicted thioesterase
MGEGWDPWAALRDRANIRLAWAHLPDGLHGLADHDHPTGWVVTLGAHLDRIGRRCTLAHELVHVERGIVTATVATMEREEAIVRAETARRLVPLEQLAETVQAMVSVGQGVEARHVAEFYDVTIPVASEALRLLTNGGAR